MPVRGFGKLAVGGLVGLAWLCGSGVASADASRQKEACQLMDSPEEGYAPAEYAFMVLRSQMSAEEARSAMSLGTQNYCPNHVTDLPAGWR
jgi:hypothetical protein